MRLVSFFNWNTQIGFETEALILIVGASIKLCALAGVRTSVAGKVAIIVLACAIQTVLPYFGHATMVKILRALIGPFIAVFVVVAFVRLGHVHSPTTAWRGWELDSAGLAFVVAAVGARLDRVRK